MGSALKAELGGIATLNFPHVPWSEISGDFERDLETQFLVSLAGPDETGLLQSLLGVTAASLGATRPAFTLDASLATSILGMYTGALIFRPTERDLPPDEVRDHLEAEVTAVLGSRGPEHRLLSCKPLGDPPEKSRRIFDGRHLSEYRFELPRECWMSQSGPLLSIAAKFTAQVAERGAPVVYMFFPQQADLLQGLATIRIGVGRTAVLRDIVLLDVAAASVAAEYGAAAKRSLGMSDQTSFRQSLVSLTSDPAARSEAGLGESAVLEGGVLDAVSVAAWAEVGLMSGALMALVDAAVDIVGISMSVIASKTVCSFVMPPGQGTRAKNALRDFGRWDHVHLAESPLSTRQPDMHSYWLDWFVPDEPGALLSILTAFAGAVDQLSPEAPMNLDYALSRALLGRKEFAGKACFSGSQLDVGELAGALKGTLGVDHPGWTDNVTVASEELSTRPWTSLDLFHQFGGAADATAQGQAAAHVIDDEPTIDLTAEEEAIGLEHDGSESWPA
jgi:hypothetical protein